MARWFNVVILLQCLDAGQAADPAADPPNGYACQPGQNASLGLPFCDTSLSIAQRVDDLISRLTLKEKLGLLHAKEGTDGCAFLDNGVTRLDIPIYAWTEEANTGADSSCLGPQRCSTTFASPALLAATFNASLWRNKGEIISTEVRALNNAHGHRGCGPPAMIGINEWGPNINLVRDARFGRNSELPSEDPYLTGRYAVEFVRGLQEGPDERYVKIQATLKHFTAYSKEENRGHDNANISAYDLADSYLRQFEMGFVEGGASGVMCSYNLINGVPNCASPHLLNDLIREKWQRPDALIVSDCGALGNMRGEPTQWSDTEVVVNTFGAGLDLNTGNEGKDHFLWEDVAVSAIADKLLSSDEVDTALRRSITVRMKAGAFDPIANQQYTKITADRLNATSHWSANLEAASQGLVLLKNSNHTLPLQHGIRLAVVGPHTSSDHGLFSDYYGDQVCWDGEPFSRDFSCVQTIGDALKHANVGGNTTVASGVSMIGTDDSGIKEALEAVRCSDVVVLALGSDVLSVEHEGQDRNTAGLPDGLQRSFALQVLQEAATRNVPVVLLLVNGGPLSVDELLGAEAAPAALLEAFFPGHRGAEAIARHVFGLDNRWGRLPWSILTKAEAEASPITDYAVSDHGRTYRYHDADVKSVEKGLSFPFGFGLSFTSFALQSHKVSESGAVLKVSLRVSNVGERSGDVVILAFFTPMGSLGPSSAKLRRQLFSFQRHTLDAGAADILDFKVTAADLSLVSEDGERVVAPGTFKLRFSTGDGVAVHDIVISVVVESDGSVRMAGASSEAVFLV